MRRVVVGVVLSLALSAGCSEDRKFDDPKDSQGNGGSGGELSERACEKDVECDDGLACNGRETCGDGFCTSGEEFCRAAEDGCSVTCSEDDGEATCVESIIDADEDGHVSVDNECDLETDLPRDDCDDDEPAVHGGAEEVCDGLDNDCDGLPDYKEGFELGGEVRIVRQHAGTPGNVPNSLVGAAWSEHHEKWSVVFAVETKLFVSFLEPNGVAAADEIELVTESGTIAPDAISIAWQNDILAVTYRLSGTSGLRKFVRFKIDAALSEASEQGTPTSIVGSAESWSAKIASAGTNGFGVLFNKGSKAYVQRFTASGSAIAPLVDLGVAGWQDTIVGTGSELTAIWARFEVDESDEPLGAAFVSKTISGKELGTISEESYLVPPNVEIQSDGTVEAVRVGDGFFAMSRRRGSEVHLSRRGAGSDDCGPVQLGEAPIPVSADGEVRMTANEKSAFYVVRGSGGENDRIYPLPLNCDANATAGGLVTLDNGFRLSSGQYSLTSSPYGHLMVVAANGDLNIRVRAFGNAFCDAATP